MAAMRHLPRTALASLFSPGDLVIANDAATLPASLQGIALRERRADRGSACGVGVGPRSDPVRRNRVRGR